MLVCRRPIFLLILFCSGRELRPQIGAGRNFL